MREPDAGERLEPFDCKLLGAAGAGRSEIERVRISLRIGDQFRNARYRHLRIDDEHIGQARQDGDRDECGRIIAELGDRGSG